MTPSTSSTATTAPFHLAVWIDHQVARLVPVGHGKAGETILRNRSASPGNIHHKAGTVGAGHADMADSFLHSVADAMGQAREILIVGPADAKNALRKFLDGQVPGLAARVLGVEAMDHASEGEIRAFAAQFFLRTDRIARPKP